MKIQSLELLEPDRKYVLITVLVLLSVSFVIFEGFTVLEADSVCQKTIKKCHGLPVDGCTGFETSETGIVEKSRCEQVENITRECNSIGEEICGMNEKEIGDLWAEKAVVNGQKCSKWSKKYSIELKTC